MPYAATVATQEDRIREWRREWRRAGAGVMAGTFVVGGTWVSASQTFVTSKQGQLVHPSPWGWLLLVCGMGFILGFYAWLSTYWNRMPMFGRKQAFRRTFGDTMARFEKTDPFKTYRVEIVGQEKPVPKLSRPKTYLLTQVRQALAKMREAEYGEFRIFDINNTLRVMDRTGTDKAFEPLRVFSDDSLKELLESGEIVLGEKGYALGDEQRS